MMMGTADEVVEAPKEGPVFMEDLPEEKQVVALVRLVTLNNSLIFAQLLLFDPITNHLMVYMLVCMW